MRTVTFQSVFDRVVRKLGRDPNAEIPQDAARAICDHINKRVDDIAPGWRWPEWELTEERAFRQIWNDTRQFAVVNSNGVPDEVFYLGDGYVPGNVSTGVGGAFGPNSGYYQAGGTMTGIDPPVGTLPTDTNYWTPMTNVEQYIEYDQPCRRSIGMVRGVYKQNPAISNEIGNSGCQCAHFGLWYYPMEKGIKVRGTGNPTVFITYTMPIPQYSIVPHVDGKTYSRGDITFDPTTGECFQALSSTSDPVNLISSWRRVPFLAKWATFVVEGAFSDALYEYDQGGNGELQAKAVLAERAETKAQEAFLKETDVLQAQGQKVQWRCFRYGRRYNGWCETLTWDGSAVSTITSDCQSDLGWVYPIPVIQPISGFFYFQNVNSLKTTTPTLVATVLTASLLVGSMAVISTGQHFRLDSGAGDNTDPGQGQPGDYNALTNNKHWIEVI